MTTEIAPEFVLVCASLREEEWRWMRARIEPILEACNEHCIELERPGMWIFRFPQAYDSVHRLIDLLHRAAVPAVLLPVMGAELSILVGAPAALQKIQNLGLRFYTMPT